MCHKARTRWVGVAGKMENACVPHTPYMRATACLDLPLIVGRLKSKKAVCTTYFPCRTLNSNSRPSSLPWERVRERATSRKACIWGREGVGKIAAIRRMPSPQPSPTGRERIAADSSVAGRLKKNARNINGRNFSGSLYRKADGTNAASVFSDDL